jgi:hypothetical protein
MMGYCIRRITVKIPGGEVSFREVLLQNLVFRIYIDPELVFQDLTRFDLDLPQVIFS